MNSARTEPARSMPNNVESSPRARRRAPVRLVLIALVLVTMVLPATALLASTPSNPGAPVGLAATATGSRLAAGIDITPFPFVDLRGAYMIFHGISGYELNVGVGF